MADVRAGLDETAVELGDTGGLDFAAILREKGVPAEAPIDADLDEDDDDDLEPEEETEEVEEDDEDDEEEESEDDDSEIEDDDEDEESDDDGDPVDTVLARFGIDPENATEEQRKLAKSYADVNSLRGKLGNEVGELRQQVEALQAQIQQPAPVPARAPITAETVAVLDEVVQQGGQAAANAALWAMENDPTGQLFNRAMQVWASDPEESLNVMRFQQALADFGNEMRLAQRLAPIEQQKQLEQEHSLFEQSWGRVAATRSDMGKYGQTMFKLIEQSPRLRGRLASAIETGDPGLLDDEIENLYLRAKELAPSGDSRSKKKAATVMKPGRSAGRSPKKSAAQDLKERIGRESATSIAAGLVVGDQ